MLVQKHREYEKDESEGCFVVGKSEKEIFDDLKYYCDHNKEAAVYYYVHPVRPSKENLRPEFMMEIEKLEGDYFCIMPFWKQAQ